MSKFYKHLVIDKFDGPPTQEELWNIEKFIDRKLPQAFKDFLLVANGGYNDYIISIDIEGEISELSFGSIYNTHPKDGVFGYNTFIGEIEIERSTRNIPFNFLPFANDGGGSVIYLDLTILGTDPVVAFIEGLPEWTGLPFSNGFFQIARSFDEYISKLAVDKKEIKKILIKAIENRNKDQINEIIEYLDIGLPDWRKIFQIDI